MSKTPNTWGYSLAAIDMRCPMPAVSCPTCLSGVRTPAGMDHPLYTAHSEYPQTLPTVKVVERWGQVIGPYANHVPHFSFPCTHQGGRRKCGISGKTMKTALSIISPAQLTAQNVSLEA
eukprot:scaffold269713_cov19-Prasinocladus_malaysianus.AAC.1